MSLDDKISSCNAPSRALYESHTRYSDSNPRSVTAVNREAPSSGSSGNLGQGPWGERHPSSVGPALGSEGHYADMAAEELAYSYTGAQVISHSGACTEREWEPVAFSHTTNTHINVPLFDS